MLTATSQRAIPSRQESFEVTANISGFSHQGETHSPRVLLRYSYAPEKAANLSVYPDYEQLTEATKKFFNEVKDPTQYWEVLAKSLCRGLLRNFPGIQEISVNVTVEPSIKYSSRRTAACAMTQSDLIEPTAALPEFDQKLVETIRFLHQAKWTKEDPSTWPSLPQDHFRLWRKPLTGKGPVEFF